TTNRLVAHRLVRVQRGGFLARGDATLTADLGIIAEGSILGQVVAVRRRRRRAVYGGAAGVIIGFLIGSAIFGNDICARAVRRLVRRLHYE
ncbi:MAG TPA: hypothetical protein VMW69_00165, partial [Spirochaetia bacterium]|nr:hypothetical protein [Spirochaetia bacterium]